MLTVCAKEKPQTAACPICREQNTCQALFCSRCTSPLAVAGLHELTARDREICLGALMDVAGEAMRSSDADEPIDENLWQAYLSAQWLRPETALIQYAEALAIRTATANVAGPWLDLGCGDGVHAALYNGWRFAPDFDCFQSLDPHAADIYNHFDPVEFAVRITRPGRKINHGIDIKPTAIARAKALGAFSQLQQADATQLPLPDNSISVIFSNMLRDLGEPLGDALGECRRILRPGGVLLISAMTPAYPAHLYFAPRARQAERLGNLDEARQLLRLDRGRSIFCQRQLSPDAWRRLLSNHGLHLDRTIPIVGQRIIRFWDIGLRPFTSTLLNQRVTWQRTGALPTIKQSALSFLNTYLRPLVRSLTTGETCMHLLVIRKG